MVTARTHSDSTVPMDPEVFRRVYDSEFQPVWHSLRRFGVRERDLEDAVHEVFVVVHRKWGDYDPERPLRPWLVGIAFRVASDFRKKAQHRREIAKDDIEVDQSPLSAPQKSADQQMESQQNKDLVHLALAQLDEERRAILVLHELEGMPVPAIAELYETMGQTIPINTLYSRLRLGREQFTKAVRQIQAQQRLQIEKGGEA